MATNLEAEAAKVGLRISHSKTKVMRTDTIHSHINIQIGNTAVERVQQFPYLGSIPSYENGSTETDVNRRVGKASTVFQKMRPIWSTQKIIMQTKSGSSAPLSFQLQLMPARHGKLQQRWQEN